MRKGVEDRQERKEELGWDMAVSEVRRIRTRTRTRTSLGENSWGKRKRRLLRNEQDGDTKYRSQFGSPCL